MAKVQPTVALAGTSRDELAKRQQRGELNSRPSLPLMLEAASPAQRQKQAAVKDRQAEIDAGQAALAAAIKVSVTNKKTDWRRASHRCDCLR